MYASAVGYHGRGAKWTERNDFYGVYTYSMSVVPFLVKAADWLLQRSDEPLIIEVHALVYTSIRSTP